MTGRRTTSGGSRVEIPAQAGMKRPASAALSNNQAGLTHSNGAIHMPQATEQTTTNLTRRTALAGIAGAAAAGITPAIAATTDPIFAVIECHRAALEIYDEAHEHFEAMNAAY